ncbi:ADAMTS-like protein 1 isoform X2 [Ostrea edulis]|uniref:ADAMTS-like protein 1 isoform X2 n=1 Tax=Ostrea edulis TaxID=37623 RepID=UPI0024AFFF58|nr:ADAMTS-like protein 1 isoform X2 [Ostrea edulis]
MWTGLLSFILLIYPQDTEASWSRWSGWSMCSKSCDGGLSNQKRRCFGNSNCLGSEIRYRHCNTRSCSGFLTNDNDRICNIHNNPGSASSYREWVPISQQTYPCYVLCRDLSGNIPNEIKTNKEDGTKCSSQDNFYCIKGECKRLGCDWEVWSNKVIDSCGICGGDGSRCAKNDTQSHFYWLVDWSSCSVTCGTGHQESVIRCMNRQNKRRTMEYYCDRAKKPNDLIRECSLPDCRPQWEISSYGRCSVECGGGIQRRNIRCVQRSGRANLIVVGSYQCPDPIPMSEKACNLKFCPARWQTGKWSQCSVSCGIGTQIRSLTCVKYPTHGIEISVSHSECFNIRPEITRACTVKACFKEFYSLPSIVVDNSTFIQYRRMKRVYLNVGGRAILLAKQPVKIKCIVKNMDSRLIFWTKDDRLIPVTPYKRIHVSPNGVLKIKRTDPNIDKGVFTCMAGIEKASTYITFHNKKRASKAAKSIKNLQKDKTSLDKPQSDKIPGSYGYLKPEGSNSSDVAEFMVGDWSACSRTCGKGLQTRKVTCSVYTDNYIKIVPATQCKQQAKPVNVRKCLVQEFCPQWEADKWGECSIKNCKRIGKAVQHRTVFCTNGNGSSIHRSKCQNIPVPTGSRECENTECEVEWQTSRWTKCKPLCSPRGKKFRLFSCVWKKTHKLAHTQCKTLPRPLAWKPCKSKCINECRDHSRYCSLVGKLKMCRYQTFVDKCCQTCKHSKG